MTLLAQTPAQIILGNVNSSNTLPVALSEENLYFGRARLDADGVTTILPTVGKLGSEYTDYADLRYRRIDFSKIIDVRPLIETVGVPTLHDMLPVINQKLGLNLLPSDVENIGIQLVNPGEEVNLVIKATPGGIGYVGNFVIKYRRKRPLLSSVVKKQDLDRLNHPIPVALQKHSLTALMWSLDFTADRSIIAVNKGAWLYQTAVRDLMILNGFPDWPAAEINGVKDYATRDVPTANQAFDRVVIQTNVSIDTFYGDAYFHYNLS